MRALMASLRRLGVSRLDRAGEASLVRSTLTEGSRDRLHRLIDIAAGSLFGLGTIAHFDKISAVAVDEDSAVAGRTVARHDDGGLECFQPVEAREPLAAARMNAGEGRLRAH